MEAARHDALERLGARRRELQEIIDELTQALAEAEERADHLASSRPRRRSKREELTNARRTVERYRAQLTTAEQALVEIDERVAATPSVEQLHDRLSRARVASAEPASTRQRDLEPPSLGLGL